MTTRSRFALVLGVAGLVVAGVQLAMLSDPPTVVQLVVVGFWSVVGVAYLGSAAAQHVRGRRRPDPAPPVPAPLEEIVPVPVRPARPRPRPAPAEPVASEPSEPTRVAIRGRPRPAPAPAAPTPAAPTPAARERHAAQDRPVPRPAARAEAGTPGADATTDATTDAFTVRAADTSPPASPAPPAPERPVLRAVSGDAGLPSALSFGPSRGRTVAVPGREARRPRPTPPFGQPRVEPSRPVTEDGGRRLRAVPDPLSDPLPLPIPSASPLSGPLPLPGVPTGAVPAPRARHRADGPDPVAARRGVPRHGRPTEDR